MPAAFVTVSCLLCGGPLHDNLITVILLYAYSRKRSSYLHRFCPPPQTCNKHHVRPHATNVRAVDYSSTRSSPHAEDRAYSVGLPRPTFPTNSIIHIDFPTKLAAPLCLMCTKKPTNTFLYISIAPTLAMLSSPSRLGCLMRAPNTVPDASRTRAAAPPSKTVPTRAVLGRSQAGQHLRPSATSN